ncbi:beta-ketoacyl synthase N-terminal-like domain-containing protein, partial [Moraxella catarrhalis]
MTQSAKNKSAKPAYHEKSDTARIVITGMGALTPIGNSLETIWQNLTQGVSGITRLDGFEDKSVAIDGFRAQIAGLVKNFDAKDYLNPKEARRFDTFVHYAQVASAMALYHAGLIDDIKGDSLPINVDGERFGVVMGSGIGGIQTIETSRDTLKSYG